MGDCKKVRNIREMTLWGELTKSWLAGSVLAATAARRIARKLLTASGSSMS